MNRTRIDWADFSWNPITGCLGPNGRGPCEYCYAKRIAERFHGPGGFAPAFHPERLDEPAKITKPSRIFVGSMADLFGEWVPDEWINKVMNATFAAPQHQYLFLTKNPKRYHDLLDGRVLSNWWLGATVTTKNEALDDPVHGLHCAGWHTWLSAEPLLEDIADAVDYRGIDWLVIGAMTGPGSQDRQPKKDWVNRLKVQAVIHGVPMFEKASLAKFHTFGSALIQQYPQAMTQEKTA